MLKHLQTTVEDLPSPPPFLVLLEVAVVTLLLPALGLWRHPQDPFFLHAGFPWLVLAPLLIGLRYGFAHGLGSAVALNLLMYVCIGMGRAGVTTFPGSLALGLLLVAMLAGEFCDMWHRRLHHMTELNYHHHMLMQKFTRSYHLLTLSHERLERRVLANTKSLRETMTYLRERALLAEVETSDSSGLSHLFMEVLGSFGMLQVAALYRADAQGVLSSQVAAKLGNPKPVRLDDPLLLQALKTKQLTCIRPEQALLPAGEEPSPDVVSQTLLAVLPLVDVSGRLWGVVAVQAMPFAALNREHLNLLAVLGGQMGDMLALAAGGAVEQFHTCLLRSHIDARDHGMTAMLLALVIDPQLAPRALLSSLLERHRALDQEWLTENRHGHRVLLMVMPLTDAEGARGYVQRLENFCQDHLGKPLQDLGVRVQQVVLDGNGAAQDKLLALKEACEIHGA